MTSSKSWPKDLVQDTRRRDLNALFTAKARTWRVSVWPHGMKPEWKRKNSCFAALGNPTRLCTQSAVKEELGWTKGKRVHEEREQHQQIAPVVRAECEDHVSTGRNNARRRFGNSALVDDLETGSVCSVADEAT